METNDVSEELVIDVDLETEEKREEYEVQRDIHNKEFSLFLDSTKVEQEFHITLRIIEGVDEKDVKLRPVRKFDLETPEGIVPYPISNLWRALRAVAKNFNAYTARTDDGKGKQISFNYTSISGKSEDAKKNM